MMHVSISAYGSPEEAPTYRLPDFYSLQLVSVAVVAKGTKENKSTLDVVLEHSDGQKYVALIPSSFVPVLARVIQGVEAVGSDQRPAAWYEETCGALVTNDPCGKFTDRSLAPETARSYGANYVLAESMNVFTARALAEALGYAFQPAKPE